MKFEKFTEYSTVGDVIGDAAFKNFGRLLFSQVYLWYSHIQVEKTLDILNTLKERALEGEQVFYPIYTQREMAADGTKRDTGLFFFRGKPGKEFAVMNAGGAFYYVGAMHDSFPHALGFGTTRENFRLKKRGIPSGAAPPGPGWRRFWETGLI